MNYQRHPLSAAWPNMQPEEFSALVESIQYHGLRDPIVLLDGQVLDGWHRYTACVDAGMEPTFTQFEGDDPVAYISDKHNRRSLNLTQRMTAIALMNKWAPSGAAGHKSKVEPGSTLTHADLAKQAGGSTKTAQQVKVAIARGTKEVVDGMKDGTLSAKRAAEIAKLPAKEQAKAINEPTAKPAANDEPEDDGPSASEIAFLVESEQADRDAMQKLLDADDKLAEAFNEIKRLNAEVAQLRLARDGYMNKSNEMIRTIKSMQRKIDKLEKVAA